MLELPSTLDIDVEDKQLYEHLQHESIFKDLENKDIFILAMVYGFKNKKRKIIRKKMPGSFFRSSYLKDKDWAIIMCIAIYEENIEVLNNPEKIIQISEEYAHGGLELIISKIHKVQFGTLEKWLESEVFELNAEFHRSK